MTAAPAPIVVLGPTASGKSDVAMAFALERRRGPRAASAPADPPIEIVAVDAMQVYRGMDIGTAKPTAADRAEVVHHGIDLVDPSEEFALPEFAAAATGAVEDIERRGAQALLVAGTGLYLRAVTDPMEVPGTWPEVRAHLEARAATQGVPALHAELRACDPLAASRMEPTNVRRVVRALEVCLGSGRPFSSFGPGVDTYPSTRFRMVGLRWARPVLAERIAVRVQRMLAAGLLDEVARLVNAPGGMSRTARQALGYKELIEHLEGRASLDEAVEQIIVRTRQFAVRQERWFRRDPRIRWVDVGAEPVMEVLPILREWTAS